MAKAKFNRFNGKALAKDHQCEFILVYPEPPLNQWSTAHSVDTRQSEFPRACTFTVVLRVNRCLKRGESGYIPVNRRERRQRHYSVLSTCRGEIEQQTDISKYVCTLQHAAQRELKFEQLEDGAKL